LATSTARLIRDHRISRRPLPRLGDGVRPVGEPEAYAVQRELHALLAPDLGAVVGHKIGCTTPVMQRFLNIPNPCAGGVFATTVHTSPARLRHADYLHVGVEVWNARWWCGSGATCPLPARRSRARRSARRWRR
jgi:2-oxo-3-hexenedioate decarboxylase/2-keto-4-pentenoate hydratase